MQKTKDQATQTLLKTGRELLSFGWVNRFCSTCGTIRVYGLLEDDWSGFFLLFILSTITDFIF
jgi:hypothetical protein